MKIIKFLSIAILTALLFTACEKETTITTNTPGSITFEIDHYVGGKKLVLEEATYTNSSDEEYSVSMLKYYISNFSFKNEDGETYTVPQDSSYVLVSAEDASPYTFTFNNLPVGNYTEVNFMIGVDSLKNTSPLDSRVGVLSLDNNMFWSWNPGYIFFKLEGKSAAAPADTTGQQKFRYHIGGFGGLETATINNIKTVSLSLPTAVSVEGQKDPVVHLVADINKVFEGEADVSIANNSTVMFNSFSTTIANNYKNIFDVDHVHND